MTTINENPVHGDNENIDVIQQLMKEHKLALRSDVKFLEKVFALKSFDVNRTFTVLKNYDHFQKQNSDCWLTVRKSQLDLMLSSGAVNVIEGFDKRGFRMVCIKPGVWEPKKASADVLLQVAGLLMEIVLAESQLSDLGNGLIVIFDLVNVGLKQIHALSTKFAKKMVHFMADCSLIPLSRIHVIREPKVCSLIYSVFKTFMDEGQRKRILFHGNDFNALHNYIDTSVLPPELGGTCSNNTANYYLKSISSDIVKKELFQSGYVIIED